jgi:site-specific DNA recombinase
VKRSSSTDSSPAPTVRCAVYTRKSSEEGLDKEFNSLDAQREAGEAYVKSQAGLGWACLADRYDDGGYSGGNTDRPALKRLLADIEAGRVDAVVVYKVDRLSRSLTDFAKLIAQFDQHHVSFVSVTQQFNTATSMGRLVLNVLLSFAQFEREIIAERTRDKIAASRRKGKWTGGRPVLGYDVDRERMKLVVSPTEAARVRQIFQLYLEHESLLPVVQELNRRGWSTKPWVTRKGVAHPSRPFGKTALHQLLTNVLYAGRVRYRDEVHPGEHPAIIDLAVWDKVQATLARNARTGGKWVRNKYGAFLKGLLRCGPCGCAMTPSHSSKGVRKYRYYLCLRASQKGWAACPSKSVPAQGIEDLVRDRLRAIGQDPSLVADVLAAARAKDATATADRRGELKRVERDLRAWHAELKAVSGQFRPGEDNAPRLARLSDLQERIASAEVRAKVVRDELAAATPLDDDAATAALVEFDRVWDGLTLRERERVVRQLVEQVTYDGKKGTVAITFRPTGIQTLAQNTTPTPTRRSA